MSWLDAVPAYRHLTPDLLRQAMPRCRRPISWARALDDAIDFFGIDDVAMLLAQVGHESADLTRLTENLHYSAERLQQVWPSRFPTLERARRFAGNPEALANEVYADRMGNTLPGDGWRFRGRGPIQLTGRYNYTRFSIALDDGAPLQSPQVVAEPEYGALAACWYVATRVTPRAGIEQATKEINGGLHGLADRRARYDRIRTLVDAGKAH